MVTNSRTAERKAQTLNRLRARAMRSKPVEVEDLFWFEVRNRKLGFKFKRQFLIGPYIADFVCVEKNLIVELDGPLHDAKYDAKRDVYLRERGFTVLRFTNDAFKTDFATVLSTVLHALSSPSPNPLPHMRGGEG